MKNSIALVFGQLLLVMYASSSEGSISINKALIREGAVHIEGDQAPKGAPISWEGIPLGIASTNGGAFKFDTGDLPADCVGLLTIGSESRDVVINDCTPANVTVIEVEAGVAQTGQTTSFAIGDDGDLEAGVVSPSARFTDNGNGTITDNLTRLIWLKNANCFGFQFWDAALTSANNLADGQCGLSDASVAGDWRLPNIRELFSLIDFSQFGPALPSGHPFSGFQPAGYWSSTSHAFHPNLVWILGTFYGQVNEGSKAGSLEYFIAVRGG